MTPEQAITGYLRSQKFMQLSGSPSTDLERTKNSEAFREAFIEILESVNMIIDSAMQLSGLEAGTGKM
jgi:hypothetical protein